jgi:peptidoglycan/xylan/chitin deacetylase (PgdA/CDA1 family)
VQAIVAGGHEIGQHTYSHPVRSFWCAGPIRLGRELDLANAVLIDQGVRPRRFRVPAGLKCLWLEAGLRARGLAGVGWTTRGLETWQADPAQVAERVLRGLRPGHILLLHEGPRVPAPLRVRAIALVLEGLDRAGYRCVIPTDAQLRGRPEPVVPPALVGQP